VAYYFTRGSTKAEVIVQYLKEVLDACQNAGLKVVATVCDMGASNVKPLKLLGASKRKPLFRFHDQDIATVYDPPHLLKCTRNLFLKYDVQLKSEHLDIQLPVVKWDHILKLYEINKPRPFRQLYRLTDTHLHPTTQSTMKVSLTAQVMSHTVAAGLNTLVAAGKDHCTLCYELYAAVKEVANNEDYFSKLMSTERSFDETSLPFIISETVY
jgi:hypothetical protein